MPGGIEIKTRDEIAYMREASLIVFEVLEELTRAVAPGVTLEELDAIAERETVRRGGICAFKGLYGFPKNICISVTEQVVHGIPTRRKLVEGDLLKHDYGVIKRGYDGDYVVHGIGKKLHEDPQVPNYGPALWSRGQPNPRMRPGMVLAIEPMINLGTHEVDTLPDGWTVVTRDGKLSSHWEHTIAVTEDGPRVLTRP